jgi:pyruvate formate lyase activating enzyme
MDTLADVATPRAIARAAADAGCRSVAYTYNDPVIFAEYAIDTAHACRELGIASVAVSAGYITEKAREEFFGAMDAANIDLKAFTENFYHKLTFSHLAPVLETLQWLRHESKVWFEITTLLIPEQNDSEKEIAELTEWVAEKLGNDVPLHFSAFHPDFKMTDIPHTPAATLKRARQQAIAAGLKHVYTGNVHDHAGQSTYCAGCGALVIGRDWYQLDVWNLDAQGRCKSCGHTLAGRYEARPGEWGSRRRRLIIHA